MKSLPVCLAFVGLLCVQPVRAQEIANILLDPTPAPPPSSNPSVLAAGTPIRFVLLDPVSSKTAVKGQPVRFAVAEDVMVNGLVAIPRGTLTTGVVAKVQKGILSKKDPYLALEPRTVLLTDGTRLQLMQSTDDCQIGKGGCWVFAAVVTVGVAIEIPIELPILAGYAIVHALKHVHRRRVLTPLNSQTEVWNVNRAPCTADTAYTAHAWKLPNPPAPPPSTTTEENLRILLGCPAD